MRSLSKLERLLLLGLSGLQLGELVRLFAPEPILILEKPEIIISIFLLWQTTMSLLVLL